MDSRLVELLARCQSVLVYGGDESEDNHVDSVIDVRVCLEEHLCHVRKDRGVFLLSFLVSNGEAE